MSIKAYPFQRRGVRRIERFKGRALLADEMGLGKTAQTLWWIKYYYKHNNPIVIVCPKTVKVNWQREALRFVGIHASVLETNIPRRLEGGQSVYIINYDILGSWVQELRRIKPKLIVGDEIHYIKTMDTQRTKHFRKLCRRIPHVIALSGTPATNRPIELFPIINILKPKLFPSYTAYGDRYCAPEITHWGKVYKGAERLDELHGILKESVMIRRRKIQVLKDLPAKNRIVLPVQLSSKNMAEYKHAETDFIRWLMATRPDKAMRARAAERLVKMGYLKRLAASMKMDFVNKWIEDFMEESDGKLIAFGIHTAVLYPLHEKFKDNSTIITGKVSTAKRQIAIDAFTKNKNTRIMFGNIQAAGAGWNGQVAQDVFFAELDWVPGNHNQAEDRAHRMGQKGSVNVYYAIAENTIEQWLAELLQSKQRVLDELFDGKVQDDSINIMDALENMFLEKGKSLTKGKK